VDSSSCSKISALTFEARTSSLGQRTNGSLQMSGPSCTHKNSVSSGGMVQRNAVGKVQRGLLGRDLSTSRGIVEVPGRAISAYNLSFFPEEYIFPVAILLTNA